MSLDEKRDLIALHEMEIEDMPQAKGGEDRAKGLDRFRHNATKAGAKKSAIDWWASR